MKRIYKLISLLTAMLSLFTFGCGNNASSSSTSSDSTGSGGQSEIHAQSIITDTDSLTLAIKEYYTLKTTVLPQGCTDELVFVSQDTKVASVDKNGAITALSAGETQIKITCGKINAYVKVEVTPPPESIKVTPSEIILHVGESEKLEVTLPSDIAGNLISYSSDNPSVAEVSVDGNVKALAVGEAIITVKCKGRTQQVKAIVKNITEPYTKVVLMFGQSNMFGCSFSDYLTPTNIGKDRYDRLQKPFDNIKIATEAKEVKTLDDFYSVDMPNGINKFTEDNKTYTFFGPEVGIAEKLSAEYPNENIYLIKASKGGVSLYDDWKSPSREGGASYFYNVYISFVKNTLEVLKKANLNPKIVGICWMQGEADAERRWSEQAGFAYADTFAKAYERNLGILLSDLRKEFNEYAVDKVKVHFIDAYINDGINPLTNQLIWYYHETVNNAKHATHMKDAKYNIVMDTLASNLVIEGKKGLRTDSERTSITPIDPLHYDSTSMLKLGNMFAEEIIKICKSV